MFKTRRHRKIVSTRRDGDEQSGDRRRELDDRHCVHTRVAVSLPVRFESKSGGATRSRRDPPHLTVRVGAMGVGVAVPIAPTQPGHQQ
jgi:hypothetical protein